ncbi:3836_t:CDS:1 [Funneliformis caledonium]|uniref:3836_t:CDS:1 n=1 Tax=Funneliformis caledonium TaxID=1117310 RepID=A0A9N8VSE5_9GLOM|nr:3836_t:CDS:1 [Funneliformis caledonium]
MFLQTEYVRNRWKITFKNHKVYNVALRLLYASVNQKLGCANQTLEMTFFQKKKDVSTKVMECGEGPFFQFSNMRSYLQIADNERKSDSEIFAKQGYGIFAKKNRSLHKMFKKSKGSKGRMSHGFAEMSKL